MKNLLLATLSIVLLFSCTEETKHKDIEEGWKKMLEIEQQIKAPVFPDRQFVITDYGAKDDGSLCTEAFEKAIKACHEAGGGTVLVPQGKFVTGAIHLLSNVNLHISEGAEVLFSTDPKDYLPVVRTLFEGCDLYNYSPLIYAYKQENIAITGKGVLDGQASMENWWPWKRLEDGTKGFQFSPNSVPRLMNYMTNRVPIEERIFGEDGYLRPSFIQPYLCKNILIEDVTVKRPPMWMIHPVLSENITVRGVKLFSPKAPNGDGFDPEYSKNILIENCEFNTGDDCIALKSGRNKDGYDRGIPTENVIIRNCKMKDGHGGIVIGSESSGGVRNVYVYDCEMDSPKLDRGLRLKSNKYRGGVIENIYLRNIKIGRVRAEAIRINQDYFTQAEPSDIKYTTYRNIFVENMTCDAAKYAIRITGLEEHPVENIKVINSSFKKVRAENEAVWVNNLVLENVEINGKLVEPLDEE